MLQIVEVGRGLVIIVYFRFLLEQFWMSGRVEVDFSGQKNEWERENENGKFNKSKYFVFIKCIIVFLDFERIYDIQYALNIYWRMNECANFYCIFFI